MTSVNDTDLLNASNEDVMSRRFIASYGLIKVLPELCVVTQGAVNESEMDVNSFSAEQKREIREFAISYTEKVMITGSSTELWALIPSIFPASTYCVALKFYIPPADVLRLVREDKGHTFVISRTLEVKCARMSSRIESLRAEFFTLCEGIRNCFCNIYLLDSCRCADERKRALLQRCYGISYFTGCPIDLSIECKEGGDFSKMDFSLLCAFVYTMLISARNNAPKREASVKLFADSKAASVEVSFEGELDLCMSPEQLEWSKTANDKGMFIDFSCYDQKIKAILRPVIDECIYTEIKQRFEMNLK